MQNAINPIIKNSFSTGIDPSKHQFYKNSLKCAAKYMCSPLRPP